MVWPIEGEVECGHGGMVCTKVWKAFYPQALCADTQGSKKEAGSSSDADKGQRDFTDVDILKVGEFDVSMRPSHRD